jgi:pimeloyl-ACP methyl ester carboxylesterase
MSLPILHFAHANGFPANTYRALFTCLRRHYDVRALSLHAHNPKYPVDNGWQNLARELLDELVARYDQPVILVGHSLGGALCLMAAKARPDLVRCVVLLDSPVVAGWRALAWRIAKGLGKSDRWSPARFSARRRTLWPDAQTVYKQYASKPVFARWAPEVLQDYIEHGLAPHPQGVTLRFTREVETAIYRTLPHDFGKLIRHFPVPVGFIGGQESAELRQAGSNATRRLVGRHFRLLPGGHLFPMEAPALAAQAVHEMIQELTASEIR